MIKYNLLKRIKNQDKKGDFNKKKIRLKTRKFLNGEKNYSIQFIITNKKNRITGGF